MRRNRVLIVAVVGMVVAVLAGCSVLGRREAGPVTTESRSIADVSAVELRTSGSLRIKAGSPAALTITAGRQQLAELSSTVENGTLILDSTSGLPSGDFSYELTMRDLTQLRLAGSGGVDAAGVGTGAVVVDLSGSGSASLTGIDADSITVQLSGSGAVVLAGQARTQQVDLSGSGAYDGGGLDTQDADVTVSGSGDAEVQVSGTLRATVNGSGNITYSGSPASVQSGGSGSGEVSGG